MKPCDSVQQRLASDGLALASSDAGIRQHLATCADCARVLHDLRRLEETVQNLPAPDAPDALVAQTLQAVRRAARPDATPRRPRTRRHRLAAGLAASVVVVASFALTFSTLRSPPEFLGVETASNWRPSELAPTRPASSASRQHTEVASARNAQAVTMSRSGGDPVEAPAATAAPSAIPGDAVAGLRRDIAAPKANAVETVPPATAKQESSEQGPRRRKRGPDSQEPGGGPGVTAGTAGDINDRRAADPQVLALLESAVSEAERPAPEASPASPGRPPRDLTRTTPGDRVGSTSHGARPEPGREAVRGLASIAKAVNEESGRQAFADQRTGDGSSGDRDAIAPSPAREGNKKSNPGKHPRSIVANEPRNGAAVAELRAFEEAKGDRAPARGPAAAGDAFTAQVAAGAPTLRAAPESTAPRSGERRAVSVAGAWDVDVGRARERARQFLNSYRSLDKLSFQAASGYWSNSYIPGDPAMRLLQLRLNDWQQAVSGPNARLEQAVLPVRQPFDAPTDAAMAVYLHGDTAAVNASTRLRVQVGLKGAERQGGHRPAMNIALVLDLRNAPQAQTIARMRALILALQHARQPEDRFSLTVAGPGGGLLVGAKQFRHGPLQVAMARTLGAPRRADAHATPLHEALSLASDSVREGSEPRGVLGSSLLILATASSVSDDLQALERLVHRNAIAGVALSVVSLGGSNNQHDIDRLVAAGQGNLRVLDSAQAADALVDRELHSASRAIARALRLRIRLAPGVKLIEVIGSRRLLAPDAERVREAEQAIDQGLARTLGIRSDRGEDEEGIQIVIPTFYAGDTHVILLDVLAPGAGPIADVTLRYKDVVHLRNGVAQANLTIGNGPAAVNPLQANVLKNLVAFEFAREARAVGRDLAARDATRAAARLAQLRDLMLGLRLELRGWQSDPDLLADEAVLNRYLTVLGTAPADDVAQRRHLADSLRYTAFRKLQPVVP